MDPKLTLPDNISATPLSLKAKPNRKKNIIKISAIIIILVTPWAFFTIRNTIRNHDQAAKTKPFAQIYNEFVSDLRTGDYTQALKLTTPGFQSIFPVQAITKVLNQSTPRKILQSNYETGFVGIHDTNTSLAPASATLTLSFLNLSVGEKDEPITVQFQNIKGKWKINNVAWLYVNDQPPLFTKPKTAN